MVLRPAISVLLPVYNGQRYLAQALQSILKQSFSDFELIAIDDGSLDGSLAILLEYAEKDLRVRVLSRANTGIAEALNDGINAARGEWLARMDADDVSLPDRFELQVNYLKAHPQCVLLGGRALLIDPYGVPQYQSDQPEAHSAIVEELLRGIGWAVLHPTAMIRADAVREAGFYRSEFVPAEDLDLFLRLSEKGEIANLPRVLIHYRQHPASANHARHEEQEEKKEACLREAYARRSITITSDWRAPRRVFMPLIEEVRMWGWNALKQKYISAARRHAWSLLKLSPLSRESWRLAFCAVRGR